MLFLLLTIGMIALMAGSRQFWGDPPTYTRVLRATAGGLVACLVLLVLSARTVESGTWVYVQGVVMIALVAGAALLGKRAADEA